MTRSADTFPGDISGVRIFWAIVAAPVVEFVCSTLCAMAVGIMVFGFFFYCRTTMPEMSQQPEPDSSSLLIAEYALTGLVTFSWFLGGFVCASISRQPTVLYPFLGAMLTFTIWYVINLCLGTNDSETILHNAGGFVAQILGGYSAVHGMNKKRKERREGSLRALRQCSAEECTVEFPPSQTHCPVCGTHR